MTRLFEIGSSPLAGGATAAAPVHGPVTLHQATIGDMRHVQPLINRFAAKNLMLPKSHDQLARTWWANLIGMEVSHDHA